MLQDFIHHFHGWAIKECLTILTVSYEVRLLSELAASKRTNQWTFNAFCSHRRSSPTGFQPYSWSCGASTTGAGSLRLLPLQLQEQPGWQHNWTRLVLLQIQFFVIIFIRIHASWHKLSQQIFDFRNIHELTLPTFQKARTALSSKTKGIWDVLNIRFLTFI